MPLYRKRPVAIEARKYTGENADEITRWCESAVLMKDDQSLVEPWLVILTEEGDMTVSLGDYVIKGVAGEFYPCKPDIFAQTYEEVVSVQEELVTKTVKQQEAKRKAYDILKKANLPIPPELEGYEGEDDADRA